MCHAQLNCLQSTRAGAQYAVVRLHLVATGNGAVLGKVVVDEGGSGDRSRMRRGVEQVRPADSKPVGDAVDRMFALERRK